MSLEGLPGNACAVLLPNPAVMHNCFFCLWEPLGRFFAGAIVLDGEEQSGL